MAAWAWAFLNPGQPKGQARKMGRGMNPGPKVRLVEGDNQPRRRSRIGTSDRREPAGGRRNGMDQSCSSSSAITHSEPDMMASASDRVRGRMVSA